MSIREIVAYARESGQVGYPGNSSLDTENERTTMEKFERGWRVTQLQRAQASDPRQHAYPALRCPLLADRLAAEAPCGPDRGGFAHRSLPCATRKLAYSGTFFTASMALIALEMFV
jgi:hypothetical protein